ncbi:MAG: ATP-binding protein [Saprospiraceae bacterium]
MKFINRETELHLLETIRKRSLEASTMTVLTGRRRIGKTRLIAESLRGEPYLYFFVARKDEKLLCEEFAEQMREVLNISVFGEINRFKDIFALLMDQAERRPISLVIDEFQEFSQINPSVFSDMQHLWDRKKDRTMMHLVLSGSVHSMMTKIFENSKEPLFGRANERLHVKPFSVETLQRVLAEHWPNYGPEDLLAFYALTGGVPKYVEQFVDKGHLAFDAMLAEILHENSLFLDEGKNVLIEEFGKEYATYFSILSLLASSKTSRGEVESVLQRDIGGYLQRLEHDYQIIRRVQPVFSKPGGKNMKYEIEDNFLNFWFRFLYKNKGAVEIGNFTYLTNLIKRDFPTYSGRLLEKFCAEKLALSGEWSEIGSYWESGFANQINLVAINQMEKKALFVEVKRDEGQHSEQVLRSKAQNLHRDLGGYAMEYRCMSLNDLKP